MKLKIRHAEEPEGLDFAEVSSVEEAKCLLASLPKGICQGSDFYPSECELQTVVDHDAREAYLEAVWEEEHDG